MGAENLSESAVRDAVVSFIRVDLNVGMNEPLPDDADLIASGVLDSLNLLRLVSFVQRTFAITVDDEELAPQNFRSLSAIAAFVVRKKNT